MTSVSADAGLTPWERRGLVLLAATMVLLGGLFELRSAFLQTRKGDLNVFLRAAWAVRAGEDIYTATDDNDHHYHYPPLLAVLLTPLADPPPGRAPFPGTLPFAVSVGIWYVVSVLLLAIALHVLASALEEVLYKPAERPARGSRRWWALRSYPLFACLPAVGGALMRGQVDMLLLALLCGMMAATLRGQSGRAGLLLSLAISIKVIPAFLLLYPVWKRDVRWLAGCAGGLVLFLGVVPAAAFGPAQAVDYYQEWLQVLVRPALTDHGDQTRADELTAITSTDSQSFVAVIHNTRYPDRATRPSAATRGERLMHWGIGGVLTLLTIAAAGGRGQKTGAALVVLLGNLTVLMIMISPVCHLHYFSLAVPLTMGLVANLWQARGMSPLLGYGLGLLFTVNVIANILPRLPGLEVVRDGGLATYAALLLWSVGCVVLWKSSRQPTFSQSLEQPGQPRLAA